MGGVLFNHTAFAQVLVRGRNVFSGFYGDEEGTEEAIDEEGWLHTGDIGRRDERGFLHLLARKRGRHTQRSLHVGVSFPPPTSRGPDHHSW